MADSLDIIRRGFTEACGFLLIFASLMMNPEECGRPGSGPMGPAGRGRGVEGAQVCPNKGLSSPPRPMTKLVNPKQRSFTWVAQTTERTTSLTKWEKFAMVLWALNGILINPQFVVAGPLGSLVCHASQSCSPFLSILQISLLRLRAVESPF